VFRIAANVATDQLRSSRARRETSMAEAVLESTASGDEPAAAVGRALDLQRALAQVTDGQRELVTMKFINGLTNAEIAEATGRSPEAIRVLQFRALAALRNILGRGDYEDGKRM